MPGSFNTRGDLTSAQRRTTSQHPSQKQRLERSVQEMEIHAKLAIAAFDTAAADSEVEAQRVVDALEKEVKADI